MRPAISFACVSLLFLAPAGVGARDADTPVPVERGWFHVPMFANQYVTMLRVHIPAGSVSNYHVHSHDLVNVTVGDYPAGSYTQSPAGKNNPPHAFKRGDVSYARYFDMPVTHRAFNPGTIPVDIVGTQLNDARPYGFSPGDRAGTEYVQVVDNDRVRAWRLDLMPGRTATQIRQDAPGVRIIVKGGIVAEIDASGYDRHSMVDTAEFYWQPAGQTRTVRNIGTTPVQIVEIELK